MPTLEGGLAIEPSSETDWVVLEQITQDVGRPAHLAESLAGLMDEDSDWEEFVVPDLASSFNSQCKLVEKTIEHAREHDEPVVFIKPKQAEMWYGAINQARLALEARYQLDATEDAIEDAAPELRSAHFRNRFYLMLQSMLLEYVMETD
ncbi:hypothetical protein JO972_07595 [Verrucomicrobiaceae bacterium 5K15]|uniref:DUF2017 domain-containing protein n=1 Tax=Oceaniferula flava TaxID=2800421 RepID=A0AAE2V9B3_9BACT|nr:DUF2017 family protein [Oceaniferula flavus]MBK1854818.1 hypothetical protein [Oceaniferula flavus]MBM1136124.1 hypothetical protein [Oceaniferula flavus]